MMVVGLGKGCGFLSRKLMDDLDGGVGDRGSNVLRCCGESGPNGSRDTEAKGNFGVECGFKNPSLVIGGK